jgi:hypothetical protein
MERYWGALRTEGLTDIPTVRSLALTPAWFQVFSFAQ